MRIEAIREKMAENINEALVGLTADVTGKKLIEKDVLLDFLNYRLTRNAKKYDDAWNDEERRKIQYQREELMVIIENVENM